MATGIELVTKALYLNGASSPINPATQALIQVAFEELLDMLTEWASLNINLGVTITTDPADEINNPPDTNSVIQSVLAVRSAPFFQLDAPMNVKSNASRLYTNLLTVYAPHPLPQWTDTLPVGSGNTRGTKPRVFFPTPEALTDSNGVPLVGGAGS